MISQLEHESFDQFGRYLAIAKIIESNRTKQKLTILDVGGFGGLIEKFLPFDSVTVLDVIDIESPHRNYIRADALSMPFKNREFDVVISSDTLEHIKNSDRATFLDECWRVSKGLLIIGAPFDTNGVAKAERDANAIYRVFQNKNYHWLEEHILNGLPKLSLLENFAKKHNLKTLVIKNNQLDEWRALISNYLITESLPSPEGTRDFYQLSNSYNKTNNQVEVTNTSYRHIVALSTKPLAHPVYEKHPSIRDFSSYFPAFKAIRSYMDFAGGPIGEYAYREAAVATGVYIPADREYDRLIGSRLSIIETELNQIKSSRSWRFLAKLRSYPIFCRLVRYTWKIIRLMKKARDYSTYLYPPNLFWRLKTSIPAYGRCRFKTLSFKQPAHPKASIIIPVYGKPDLTLNCLVSLLQMSTKYSYEVIIVDDHSKGSTPRLFNRVPGLSYLRNESNQGFVVSCNNGAKIAKGKYVVFLNNDTLVDKNWLDPLIDRLESDSNIGLVGSKLIYPDGLLQEAGGIIFSDGSGWNYGKMASPDSFEYCYSRDVDYCSGASIALSRNLFWSVGGLDIRYAPAYYEDTDLAFTIRSKGYRVVYEPESKITHLEGASSGTDLTKGIKRFQVINQKKFIKKWRNVLQEFHYASPVDLIKARDRSADKTALIIDHYVPEPDRDSGSKRMFALIKIVQEMGYKVTFWPQNLVMTPNYTQNLQSLGVEVVYGPLEFLQFSRQREDLYDLVMMSRPSLTRTANQSH